MYRRIILRVDDILNLFKDYCTEEDIPADARPVAFSIHPTTKQLSLLIESPNIQGEAEMEVRFDLRRTYGL